MVIYHGTIVQSVKNLLKQIQVKALRCRSVTIPEILIDSFVLGILLSWLFTIKNNHSQVILPIFHGSVMGYEQNGTQKCHESKRYFERLPFSKETSQGFVFKYPRKRDHFKSKGSSSSPIIFSSEVLVFGGVVFQLVVEMNKYACQSGQSSQIGLIFLPVGKMNFMTQTQTPTQITQTARTNYICMYDCFLQILL